MTATEAERFYREHHPALLRYLTRLAGDPEEAADAAQEAFRRYLERPPERTTARAWLYTVATNAVRESARTGARRRSILERAPHRAVPEPLPGPEAAFAARERRRAVEAALTELSERDRTLLLLYAEGFKHREIAQAVNTTTRSVGTLIARALRRFGSALEPRREDPT